MHKIFDDSGFLGLIDPDAYRGFVAENWTLQLLFSHFQAEMRAQRLLLWGTGLGGGWRVAAGLGNASEPGVRSIAGSIRSSRGRLLLVNYTSLTEAAMWRDHLLPTYVEAPNLLAVPAGLFTCHVTQHFDPETSPYSTGDRDFSVMLQQAVDALAPWPSIPWYVSRGRKRE